MMASVRAPSGDGRVLRAMLVLIAAVTIARLVLAATLGLGVDEAYTVATSRVLALGTFDHPPLAWWLAGGAAKVFGTEAPLIVRLPFIALGALTLWLAFDAGRTLYSARAGLYAAVAIVLAPVLGWTSGSMVLPDGPLLAGFLAGLCCLARALFGDPATAPRWWLLAGVAAGVACLSKLHGVFLLAGTGLFLITTPTHRHWLVSPWPYLAAMITLAVASPFLIWNAEHNWISFAFQAGRTKTSLIDPAGPFVALGGQALFLLPWVWVALMLSLGRAVWAGPGRPRDWLLVCCAIGPIAVFTLVAITGTKTLFHWAAPGYLFACVLLGRDLARDLDAGLRRARSWLTFSSASLAVLFAAVLGLVLAPWPQVTLAGKSVPYPLIETRSWSEVREQLAVRGLLNVPNTFVASIRWHEAGRLAVALGPAVPVRCLCADPRGFGILTDNRAHLGQDALIIMPEFAAGELPPALVTYFETIERLPSLAITQAQAPLMLLAVYLGRTLRDPGHRAPDLLSPLFQKR